MDLRLKESIAFFAKQALKIPHYQIFIFGSQATGEAKERSDYDIGVFSQQKIPPSQLQELRYLLNEKIPLLNTFEVVDFQRVSSDFKELASKKTEMVYEQ